LYLPVYEQICLPVTAADYVITARCYRRLAFMRAIYNRVTINGPFAMTFWPPVYRQFYGLHIHAILMQRSSLIAVSTLLTPRHYRCRRIVRLPLATAPFQWLQRVHGTVCHQRLGPAPHFWHSEGRPSLTFFVSHMANLALSSLDGQLCNSFRYRFCKVPLKLCDGSTVILTLLVVVVVVVLVV